MNLQRDSRRDFLSTIAIASAGILADPFLKRAIGASSTSAHEPTDLRHRLFILETWFYKTQLTLREQSKLVYDLGCPRITYCPGGDIQKWRTFSHALKQIDDGGSDLAATYVVLNIDTPEIPEEINTVISCLTGRDTLVWVAFVSDKYKPSDKSGDSRAIPLLRHVADLADRAGLAVSIYHHFGCWSERVTDAFRLAEKAERENVGCTFNLYHWLKAEGPQNLERNIQIALPKLNCITINGARRNAKELKVEEGILPLGQGDYDVESFVGALIDSGYTGPIGLQGYGIEGDIRRKLEQSLQKWEEYCSHIRQSR